MPLLQTSNELTWGHGVSPLAKRPAAGNFFQRGFVIYITAVDSAFMTRQFYCDYNGQIPDQTAFEQEVLNARTKFEEAEADLPSNVRRPFSRQNPRVFQRHVDAVSFGWMPCKVSYILDSSAHQFLQADPANGENALIQPIVFRRSKVVVDRKQVPRRAEIRTYLPNHSFFNLTTDNSGGLSYLRFDNFMLDQNGDPMKRPPDPKDLNKYCFEYCMDIHIETEQVRMFAAESEQCDETKVEIQTFVPEWVTIVLDPPQDNGGSGGPPP